MGKTSKYKGLRIDYQPDQKVKVMLGHDWFDAEVVKANKKSVVVRTLFSKTKYRRVPIKPEDIAGAGKAGILAATVAATSQVPGGLGTTLEPYTISGTKVVKLPRIRVKPIEKGPSLGEIAERVSEVAGKKMEVGVLDLTPAPDEKSGIPGLGLKPGEALVEMDTEDLVEQLEITDTSTSEAAQDKAGELEQRIVDEFKAGTTADELTMAIEQAEVMLEGEPEPEHEGPGLGRDETPLIDEPKAETKPETAADVLAELEKMLE